MKKCSLKYFISTLNFIKAAKKKVFSHSKNLYKFHKGLKQISIWILRAKISTINCLFYAGLLTCLLEKRANYLFNFLTFWTKLMECRKKTRTEKVYLARRANIQLKVSSQPQYLYPTGHTSPFWASNQIGKKLEKHTLHASIIIIANLKT